MDRRRKPGKKRRGKGSTDSSCSIHNSVSSERMEMDNGLLGSEDGDLLNCTLVQSDGEGESSRSRAGSEAVEDGVEAGPEGGLGHLLRLPQMSDTSMDTVGQPLRDVMDRLNGALDGEEAWEHPEEGPGRHGEGYEQAPEPPAQQPFREDPGGEPPDRAPPEVSVSPLATSPSFLQASAAPAHSLCFAPFSPDAALSGGGHHDSAEHGRAQTLPGAEGEGEAKEAEGQEPDVTSEDTEEPVQDTDKNTLRTEAENHQEDKLSPSESSHPAEFK